jgi:hypothetical protein
MQILRPYFLVFHFNNILSSMSRSGSQLKFSMYFSSHHARYMCRPPFTSERLISIQHNLLIRSLQTPSANTSQLVWVWRLYFVLKIGVQTFDILTSTELLVKVQFLPHRQHTYCSS